MAKKSKSVRQYNKQIQRLNKINRKAQQKGLKLDLRTPTPKESKVEKKQLQEIRAQVRRASDQVKEQKTDNKVQVTQKQLAKAIQKRQQRLKPFKPSKVKSIKQQRQKQIEESRSYYTPEEPETIPPDTVNEDTDFYSDSIIATYKDEIHRFPNSAEPILLQWLERLISKHGKKLVANMIQEGAEEGLILTGEIAYDNGKLYGYIAEMMFHLKEITPEEESDILDAFDEWTDIE